MPESYDRPGDLLGLLADLAGRPEKLGPAATTSHWGPVGWSPSTYAQEGISELASALLHYAEAGGMALNLPKEEEPGENHAFLEGVITQTLRDAAKRLNENEETGR